MINPLVSIIIPVYNAAPYIKRCVISLFEQTYRNIEYIFIDDCTPDDSISILESVLMRYPARKKNTKILKTETNSRQASARSLGLKACGGEYIIHCDPDDWLEKDHISSLLDIALSGNNDIATANYYTDYADGTITEIKTKVYDKPLDILKSSSFYFFSLCNHLLKANIVRDNKIDFYPRINYMEDFGFMARVCYYAKSIGHAGKATYHYNKGNVNSITLKQTAEDIMAQRIECMKLLDAFFYEKHINPNKLNLFMRTKRDIKDVYLTKKDLKRWKSVFPEVGYWELKKTRGSLFYRIIYLLASRLDGRLLLFYQKASLRFRP